MPQKYVYFFGPQGTEGDASMKNALGGKGGELAEMAKLGLPVPATNLLQQEQSPTMADQQNLKNIWLSSIFNWKSVPSSAQTAFSVSNQISSVDCTFMYVSF